MQYNIFPQVLITNASYRAREMNLCGVVSVSISVIVFTIATDINFLDRFISYTKP